MRCLETSHFIGYIVCIHGLDDKATAIKKMADLPHIAHMLFITQIIITACTLYQNTLTKWRCMRPQSRLSTSDNGFSNEHKSLIAVVLDRVAHQVVPVIHHLAVQGCQRGRTGDGLTLGHGPRPDPIGAALYGLGAHQGVSEWAQKGGLASKAIVEAQNT